MPLLGKMLRMVEHGGDIKDNFNRTVSSGLGATSTGAYNWNVLTGTWSDNGTNPTTATSQSSNPLAVIDARASDVDAWLSLGPGDALYFRVQDASNWWRLLWEGWQTSSCQTCCSTCCQTCYQTCSSWIMCCSQGGGCVGSCGGSCNCLQGGGCPNKQYPNQYCTNCNSCSYSCNPYNCNCTSCNCTSCNCTYYNNYRIRLEKMLAGSLSVVQYGSTVSYSTTRAHVTLKGTNITAFYDSTQIYSGTQTDLSGVTQYGIGRGNSNYNTSAIDDFEVKWAV